MRTPCLAAVFSAGLAVACAGLAQAQDCKQQTDRLAEGDWTGTYEKALDLRGSELNMRMDWRFHGSIRFHVNKDGMVENLQGDYAAEVSHSVRQGDGGETGRASASPTPLSLDDGQGSSSQHFHAKGSATFTNRGTATVGGRSQGFSQSAAGAVDLDFHLLSAACDSGSGTFESPQFQRGRDMAPRMNLSVASDPAGKWTVTNPAVSDKVKQIRQKLRSVLSSCPSFLSDTETCKPGVKQVADQIKAEPDAGLRACMTQAFREELLKAISAWVDEAIKLFKQAAQDKSSKCFMYPYINKAVALTGWFEMMAEFCESNAEQEKVFDAIGKLLQSYDDRIAKGEAMRDVFGLPCPAMDRDPVRAKATQDYLDGLAKRLGLTPPGKRVVR